MKKVVLTGSRTITEIEPVEFFLPIFLDEGDTLLVGDARGVDENGWNWATDHGFKVRVFPAEWDKYGKGAGFIRNQAMVDLADVLVAVWDGKSNGTKHCIDAARKKGIKTFVYILKEKK